MTPKLSTSSVVFAFQLMDHQRTNPSLLNLDLSVGQSNNLISVSIYLHVCSSSLCCLKTQLEIFTPL